MDEVWKDVPGFCGSYWVSDQMESYYEINRISNSALGNFVRGQNLSPANYKYLKENPIKPTAAMILGTAVHLLALPGQNIKDEIFVFDESKRPDLQHTMASRENKLWKETLIAENEGKEIISQTTYQQAEDMAASLEKEAGEYLSAKDNEFEKVILYDKMGVKMKCKIDIWNDAFLAEVKTAADSAPSKWQRKAFYDWGYYRQAATYLDADADGLYTGDKDFFFLVVESSAPYLVSIHICDKGLIEKGFEEFETLLRLLKKCRKENKYPHYEMEVFTWAS